MPITYSNSIGTKALTEKYQQKELLPIKVLEIRDCNHKPHPFLIGPEHMAYASDHCGGVIGQDAIEHHPCALCEQPAFSHSYDVVMFLQLTRNSTNGECFKILQSISQEMQEDRIDGIVFVETEEKYRVSKE